MSEISKPSIRLLAKIGSVLVHFEEGLSTNGHQFDWIAAKALLADPEIKDWLDSMREAAFLPVKR